MVAVSELHASDSTTDIPEKTIDYTKIRGFNYQPSYGSNGFELWQKFDGTTIDIEIGRGKKYFPKMNAIRLWNLGILSFAIQTDFQATLTLF